jgi:hypothetical protein
MLKSVLISNNRHSCGGYYYGGTKYWMSELEACKNYVQGLKIQVKKFSPTLSGFMHAIGEVGPPVITDMILGGDNQEIEPQGKLA